MKIIMQCDYRTTMNRNYFGNTQLMTPYTVYWNRWFHLYLIRSFGWIFSSLFVYFVKGHILMNWTNGNPLPETDRNIIIERTEFILPHAYICLCHFRHFTIISKVRHPIEKQIIKFYLHSKMYYLSH